MKILSLRGASSRRFTLAVFVGILLASTSLFARSLAAVGSAAAPGTPPQEGISPKNYSTGITDLLKMSDAKVPTEVLKAYVTSSPIAYRPVADEIILMQQHGVPSEVLTAMLQRGAELRNQFQNLRAAQAASAQPAAPVPAYAPQAYAYPPAPAYDYSTVPAYADYSDSYPAYYPAYYPYNYGYNYSYSWPFYWPYYGYGYRFGSRNFRDFDRFHGSRGFGGFRNHPFQNSGFRGNFAFRGGSAGFHTGGFGQHSSAFASRGFGQRSVSFTSRGSGGSRGFGGSRGGGGGRMGGHH
jgi:hypothetical protein